MGRVNVPPYVIVDIPDLRGQIAQILVEWIDIGLERLIGQIPVQALDPIPQDSALTVTDVSITGPSSNRFDLVILAEGYRTQDFERFEDDVALLLATMSGRDPFRNYFQYMNIRSVFRASDGFSCSSTTTAYGTRWVSGSSGGVSYSCLGLDPTGFQGSTPFNVPLAILDGTCAGYDPGGLLVLINSQPFESFQPLYGGQALPGAWAIATTNRNARTGSPWVFPDLKFPEIALHELGHSIGGLADETGTFGALPGCPPPETTGNDFLEVNISQLPNRARWGGFGNKLSSGATTILGGSGCSGVCTPNLCNSTGPFWNIYHANDVCSMNLLTPSYCAVCTEELAIQLRRRADIILGDDPIPSSPVVTMFQSDTLTLRWTDRTGGQSLSGSWTIDGIPDFIATERGPFTAPAQRRLACYSGRYNPSQFTPLLWAIPLPPNEDYFVSQLGDVDSDGEADFLLSAPSFGPFDSGLVQVRSGANGAIIRIHDGSTSNSEFGLGIAGLADLDFDGRVEYAIARKTPGVIRNVDIRSGATGEAISTLTGSINSQFGFGRSISVLGDLDDDGIQEIAVGNPVFQIGATVVIAKPEVPSLTVNVATIPSSGGTQTFALDLPDNLGGMQYLLMASLSGTTIPGTPLAGSYSMPLIFDSTTLLPSQGSPLYSNPFGILAAGTATANATMSIPGSIATALTGFRFYHCAVIYAPGGNLSIRDVTNAVKVTFVP